MTRYTEDRDDPVYLDEVLVVGQTDAAILVQYEGEEVWIPKSQILSDSQVEFVGDRGILAIPRWLADDRGVA